MRQILKWQMSELCSVKRHFRNFFSVISTTAVCHNTCACSHYSQQSTLIHFFCW